MFFEMKDKRESNVLLNEITIVSKGPNDVDDYDFDEDDEDDEDNSCIDYVISITLRNIPEPTEFEYNSKKTRDVVYSALNTKLKEIWTPRA